MFKYLSSYILRLCERLLIALLHCLHLMRSGRRIPTDYWLPIAPTDSNFFTLSKPLKSCILFESCHGLLGHGLVSSMLVFICRHIVVSTQVNHSKRNFKDSARKVLPVRKKIFIFWRFQNGSIKVQKKGDENVLFMF